MTRLRQRKKPTRGQIEAENDRLRNALEDIADILEELGIIDGGEDDDSSPYDDPDFTEPDIIPGEVSHWRKVQSWRRNGIWDIGKMN